MFQKLSLSKTIVIVSVVNLIVIIFILNAFSNYRASEKLLLQTYEQRIESINLAKELKLSSDLLTMFVRAYSATGDIKFRQYFQQVLDIRNGVIPRPIDYDVTYWDLVISEREISSEKSEKISLNELMLRAGFTEEEFKLLSLAEHLSNELVKLEEQAMNAIVGLYQNEDGLYTLHLSPDSNYARNIVFSDKYFEIKADISTPIRQFNKKVDNRTLGAIRAAKAQSDRSVLLMNICIAAVVLSIGITVFWVFRKIVSPVNSLSSSLNELARGNLDQEIIELTDQNEIGDLVRTATIFRNSLLVLADQNWVKTQLADIARVMQTTENKIDAAQLLLGKIVPLISCSHAILYLFNSETNKLSVINTFATKVTIDQEFELELGQGISGQCAMEKKMICLSDIPDDFIKIGSALGSAKPKMLSAYPLLISQKLVGVIELASFSSFSEADSLLLEELFPFCALYFENIQHRNSR